MRRTEKYGTPAAQLRALTLQEKASLLSGRGFWRTKAIPEKGVKSLFMADGPHGVRKEDKLHARRNGGASVPATCFPCEGTLAYTLCAAWGRPWGKKLRPRAWAFFWGRG